MIVLMSSQMPTLATEQVWFTSDTHFGHENTIRFCNRPFKNAEEMNAELIRRWRETVPEDGIVFHLGDFAHGSSRLSRLQILHHHSRQHCNKNTQQCASQHIFSLGCILLAKPDNRLCRN